MKAVVDARAFSAALDKVSTVLKRSQIPALESVCIQFGDGKCVLTATDLESWLTTEIPAEGDAFTCGFYRNKEAAKACRYYDGLLSLEMAENGDAKHKRCWLKLSCGSRRAEFEGLAPEDIFAVLPSIQPEQSFTADASGILRRVERVKYAVNRAQNRTKPELCSVQFVGNKVYAIDGYRAACDVDQTLTVPKWFLITPGALAHLKLFGDSRVAVDLCRQYVRFSGDGLSLCCHLVESVPFQLDQAIPREFGEIIEVSPKDFLRELGYLDGFISSKDRPYIRFCGGELSLDSDRRTVSTAVKIKGKSTTPFAFDIHYMTDALKQFGSEKQVSVKLSGRSSPIVIEAEGRSDYALVVPVRLRQEQAAA